MITVACLGLGGMGGGMATALADAGFSPTVYNRSADRSRQFAERGLKVAETPREAAAGADVVVVSMADLAADEQVLLGVDGAVGALAPGAIVLDTSTISPEASRDLTARLAERGIHRVEACLIGNPAQANRGDLRVLSAGDPAALEGARPVLAAIGRRVENVGPIGAASTLKVVFNAILGAQVAALAEGVALGCAAGLEQEQVLSAIRGSGFSSAVMDFRADVMQRQAWEPAAFRSRLMAKDLALATGAADQVGLDIPVIASAGAQFDSEVAAGRGDLDAAAVLLSFIKTPEGATR